MGRANLIRFLDQKGLIPTIRRKKLHLLYVLRHKKWLRHQLLRDIRWVIRSDSGVHEQQWIKEKRKWWWIKRKRKWLWWIKKQRKWKRNQVKWLRRKRLRKVWKRKFFKKLPPFFRHLGFRFKYSHVKKIQATKAYRRVKLDEKALNISRNRLKIKEIRPTQPRRSVKRFSFFKVKYLLRKFIWNRYLGGIKWAKFYNNSSTNTSKYKLLNFICNSEMRLLPLLLRTNLTKTAETAVQFIKHGFVFINYRAALKPYIKVNEGDTLTIQIDTIKHRFFDGLHGIKDKPWFNKTQQNIVFNERLSHTKKQYRLPSLRRNKKKIPYIMRANTFYLIREGLEKRKEIKRLKRELIKKAEWRKSCRQQRKVLEKQQLKRRLKKKEKRLMKRRRERWFKKHVKQCVDNRNRNVTKNNKNDKA